MISASSLHAFTLVELSIVLVIIGLLTGGVLTGQSLIHASELRAVTSEYQRNATAVNTFRDKYFALPGDMPNATKYWGTDPNGCPTNTVQTSRTATCDGNGDGQISSGDLSNGASMNECFRATQQLADAGLIEGAYSGVSGPGMGALTDAIPGTNIQRSKMGQAGWSIEYLNSNLGTYYPSLAGGHNLWIAGLEGDQSGLNDAPFLKAEDAYNIDMKMDDGKPNTGKVWGAAGCGTDFTPTGTYPLNDTTSNRCTMLFSQD